MKRERLILAALQEFAAHGLAGARIESIAKVADVSPGLVYSFFASKNDLFEAVFDAIVSTTLTETPIDADDLPEYAAALHDAGVAHSEAARFLAWYELESGKSPVQQAAVAQAMGDKLDAIRDAQKRGIVTDRFSAEQLLSLVLGIATMWHQPSEDLSTLLDPEAQRATVVAAVRRLVEP